MIRWMLILLVSLTLLPAASASLSPKRRPDIRANLLVSALASLRRAPANDAFRLTKTTEVFLDGRPCRYEDVPNGSTITLLETASNESKEILKIHFRTTSQTRSNPIPKRRRENAPR